MVFNRNNKSQELNKYSSAEQAIITTLLYSDIFNFPLTEEEIWHYLISKNYISKQTFLNAIKNLAPLILKKRGLYFFHGRESIMEKRVCNWSERNKKYEIAKKTAKNLSRIPSILFIGISGALASGNVSKEDDIDLFIIVKKDTVFISRFWILTLLELMHTRRTRKMSSPANTICVNLIIDESALFWPEARQDLYTAREIAQIIPLINRNEIFLRFLNTNNWINNYFPNVQIKGQKTKKAIISTSFIEKLLSNLIAFMKIESIMRFVQIAYMKSHRTTETITPHHLAFHPNDYRSKTLALLKLKMRDLGLLTNI